MESTLVYRPEGKNWDHHDKWQVTGKVFWGLMVKPGWLEGLLSSTQAVTIEKKNITFIRLFPTCYSDRYKGSAGKILVVVTKDTRVSRRYSTLTAW